MKAFGKGRKPIGYLILGTNRRHRVDRRCYVQAVSVLQLLAITTVKRHPSCIATVWRHGDLKNQKLMLTMLFYRLVWR